MRRRCHLLVSLALASLLIGATVTSVTALSVQYPNQSRGDRGSNVRALQGLLRQRGAIIPVDGNFGATTVAAVKAFQASHGLPVDGVVGTTTWTALRVQMAPGASGEAVKALQRELNEKRRVGLVVDGVYGSTTTAAVKAFQRHAGLAVTGIAVAHDVASPGRRISRPRPGAAGCATTASAMDPRTGAPVRPSAGSRQPGSRCGPRATAGSRSATSASSTAATSPATSSTSRASRSTSGRCARPRTSVAGR